MIVGVGHERDVTIADLVADRRASTPTNAAEIVLPSKREMREVINGQWLVVSNTVNSLVQKHQHSLARMLHRLELTSGRVFESVQRVIQRAEHYAERMVYVLLSEHQNVNKCVTRVAHALERFVQSSNHRIELWVSMLSSSDPKKVLNRGYTMTLKRHKVIKSKSHIVAGDEIETRFVDGSVHSIAQGNPTLF